MSMSLNINHGPWLMMDVTRSKGVPKVYVPRVSFNMFFIYYFSHMGSIHLASLILILAFFPFALVASHPSHFSFLTPHPFFIPSPSPHPSTLTYTCHHRHLHTTLLLHTTRLTDRSTSLPLLHLFATPCVTHQTARLYSLHTPLHPPQLFFLLLLHPTLVLLSLFPNPSLPCTALHFRNKGTSLKRRASRHTRITTNNQ